MIRSTMVGTVSAIREHAVTLDVDGNGKAQIPLDVLPQPLREKIKLGSRMVITERKQGPDDTGEWKVRLLRVGEYLTTGKRRK